MKIENLHINQNVEFFSNRKLLVGKIIILYKNSRLADGDYFYNIEVEVDDRYNKKIDESTIESWDGSYQLRTKDIKRIIK